MRILATTARSSFHHDWKPYFSYMFSVLVRSFKMPSLPGIIGIPASFAAFLVAALSPILRTSPDGPVNEIRPLQLRLQSLYFRRENRNLDELHLS